MTLNAAYLCANCDEVGSNSLFCERCGSGALMHLGKLLNRQIVTESVEQLIESAYERKPR